MVFYFDWIKCMGWGLEEVYIHMYARGLLISKLQHLEKKQALILYTSSNPLGLLQLKKRGICAFSIFQLFWRYKPSIWGPQSSVEVLVCRENTLKFDIDDLKFLRGWQGMLIFLLVRVNLKLVWVLVNVILQKNYEGLLV